MFGGFQVGPFQPAYQQEGVVPPTPSTDVVTGGSLFKPDRKRARKIRRSDYHSQYDFYQEVVRELNLPSVPLSEVDETGNVFAEDDEIILMALTKVLH